MSEIGNCIDSSLPVAREYKRRWQSHPAHGGEGFTDLTIRIHRCCSWLGRAQHVAGESGDSALDDQLVFLWIAFNALYGRWDPESNHPARDIQSVRDFIRDVTALDQGAGRNLLGGLLEDERPLVERIFDNAYLDHYFWRGLEDGEGEDEETWRNMPRKGRHYLDAGQTERALDRLLLYRVYQLRCQLLHGGATHGGRLNRGSIADCGRFLHLFLDRSLEILLHPGGAEAFRETLGPICYPPVRPGPGEVPRPDDS